MTTIATTQHQRIPLWVSLAVAGAFVVGGTVGFTWEQDNTTDAVAPSQSTAPHAFGGATTVEEISGSTSGSVPMALRHGGGATTTEELSGSTSGSIPPTGSPGGATTSQESTQ